MAAHPLACDVYSFGIMTWQILCGERPYVTEAQCEGLSIHQIMQKVVSGYRPEVHPGDSWPEGVEQVVVRCWAGVPEERPSFDVLVLELRALAVGFAALGSSCSCSSSSGGSGSSSSSSSSSTAGDRDST